MNLRTITKLLVIAITIISGLGMAKSVHAEIPVVKIKVVNAQTGSPVVGVWAKWTNTGVKQPRTNGCIYDGDGTASRYAKTDSSGTATFIQDFNEPSSSYSTQIDTNLDGTNDATIMTQMPGKMPDGSSCTLRGYFDCTSNPHHIEIVKPQGWTGTFESKDMSFNNSVSEINLTIQYTPSGFTATPPPASNWCDPNCSTKEIGNLNTGNLQFSSLNKLKFRTDYWIRLRINNQNPGSKPYPTKALGKIVITERVRRLPFYAYFPNSTNFYIGKVNSSGGVDDVTDSVCGGMNCIKNYLEDVGYDVEINGIDANDTYYIYMKARTDISSPPQQSYVNSDFDSGIKYVDQGKTLSLNNVLVTIDSTEGAPGPTASAGPTPSPATSGSPLPSATPLNTNCTSTSCTNKQIGEIYSFGNFAARDPIDTTKPFWVRLTIKGRNSGATGTSVKVSEQINPTYFTILDPTATTFKISRPKTSSETEDPDLTSTVCPSLNCISNLKRQSSALKGFDIQLDAISTTESRYIYFQVNALQPTNSSSVLVDDTTSKVIYQGSPAETFDIQNTSVSISQPKAFFQVNGGDVYSNSSQLEAIKSPLRAGSEFAITPTTVISQKGISNFGQGEPGDPPWEQRYYSYDQPMEWYSALYTKYQKNIVTAGRIDGLNYFDDKTIGYFTDIRIIRDGKYTISGNKWSAQVLTNKQIVLFIPGNLYIDDNFQIANNGNSSITFIVQGNIGIKPTVTDISGVFIVDGVIDTACDTAAGFSGSQCDYSAVATQPLSLNGSFISKGGFNLDRESSTGAAPAELFKYRPDFLFSTVNVLGSKLYSWKEDLK